MGTSYFYYNYSMGIKYKGYLENTDKACIFFFNFRNTSTCFALKSEVSCISVGARRVHVAAGRVGRARIGGPVEAGRRWPRARRQ